MTWLPHVLGVDDVSGRWYAFWSGFGGILERLLELLVLAGILLRKHNCHQHGCWRLGRHPVAGTAFVVCARHHPRGAPTAQRIQDAHARR